MREKERKKNQRKSTNCMLWLLLFVESVRESNGNCSVLSSDNIYIYIPITTYVTGNHHISSIERLIHRIYLVSENSIHFVVIFFLF